MKKRTKWLPNFTFIHFLLILLITGNAGAAWGADQIATLTPSSSTANVGTSFTVDVDYDTSDNNNALANLNTEVYYDSSKVTYDGYSFFNTNNAAFNSKPETSLVVNDSNNGDGDSTTDKKMLLVWTSISFPSDWPGIALPTTLATLDFTANSNAPAGATNINIVITLANNGYTGIANSTSVTLAVPPGSISGTISYPAYTTGNFNIAAATDTDMNDVVAELAVAPGYGGTTANYTLPDVPVGTYYVGAYNDVSGNNDLDQTEAKGMVTGTVAVVSGQDTPSTDITLVDPVAAPTFAPGTGTYNSAQNVTISPKTGAVTTNYILGTGAGDPDTLYTAPVSVDGNHGDVLTLTAVSFDSNGYDGIVGSAVYTFDKEGPVDPVLSPTTDTYNAAQNVTPTLAGDATVTYYTTDGSVPSTSNQNAIPYNSGTITIDGNDTDVVELKIISYDAVGNASNVTTETYTFDKQGPTDPTVDIGTDTYNAQQDVTATLAGDAVTTYYTIDGSTPDANSTQYTGGTIAIDGNDTDVIILQIISYDLLGNASNVTTATYTFDKAGPVAATFDINTGFYNTAQSVTVTPAGDANTTFYTTDGSTPDNISNGNALAGAIAIDAADGAAVILKVISYDVLGNVGAVASETYTFDTTDPTVTITAPTADAHLTSNAFTYTGTEGDTGSGIATVEVSFDGTNWVAATISTSWSYQATLASGANTIQVRATDVAGNISTPVTGNTLTYYPALSITVDSADVTGGQIYVPNITGNNTKTITVTGGEGTFANYNWTLAPDSTGAISGTTDARTFTANVGQEGVETLTITDPENTNVYTATLTINVISLGVTGNTDTVVGTATQYSVVGAVGTITWSVTDGASVAGTPVASGTNNVNATVTPVQAGNFTLRATDGSTSAFADITVEVVDPVVVTPASLVVLDTTTLQFNAVGGKGGGTNANYDWTVSGNGTIDANGLFTPAAATGVRTFTATATDQTYATVSGTSATVTIVDPLAVTGDPAGNALESATTNDYDFTGGTGTVTWTATAGTIDTAGIFTAPTLTTGSELVTITATDGQFTSVTATTQVTVYADVTITNKPATEPTVEPGATSDTFTVAGGDDALYTWTVTGPVAVTGGVGGNYTFTAPTAGDFAGQYTVTVTDNKGFDDSFTVLVPMNLAPVANVITTADTMVMTVTGTSSTITFEILDAADAATEVATPADYGTWTTTTSNPNTFTPAAVTTTQVFYVRVTSDDATLTTLGINSLVGGPYRIVLVAAYTVTVSDSTGIAIPNIDVDVNNLNGSTDANGEVTFNLPDTGGTYMYDLTDANALYIPAMVSSSRTAVAVTMEDAGEAFTGTVTSELGGTLANADVAALYQGTSGVMIAAETMTDGTGAYTLYVPASAPSATYDILASLDGYQNTVMATQTPAAAPGAPVNIALWPATAVNIVATEGTNTVTMKITADPAFDNSDDAAAANAGTQLQVSLIDPNAVATGTLSAMTYSATDNSYTIVYDALEDFTVQILADTSADRDAGAGDAYALQTVYMYLVGATAGTSATGTAGTANGGAQGLAANGQNAQIEVPVGGVATDAAIAIRQTSKANAGSTSTDGSPTYIYEVVASDLTTGVELTGADINRIEITLPIDLTVIGPGDLEKGIFTIYHSVSQTALEAGGGIAVPIANIISTDYMGDGVTGSVTFWVNSLSYFGVGSAATGPKLIESSGDTRCFIATAAFGSPFETHVTMLREFRDTYLMPTSVGRSFVNAYYRLSPPMADFIAGHDTLRAAARVALIPAVGMSYMLLNFGMLQTMLLFSVMLALACMLTFRLGFFTSKEQ